MFWKELVVIQRYRRILFRIEMLYRSEIDRLAAMLRKTRSGDTDKMSLDALGLAHMPSRSGLSLA